MPFALQALIAVGVILAALSIVLWLARQARKESYERGKAEATLEPLSDHVEAADAEAQQNATDPGWSRWLAGLRKRR